MPIIQIRLSAVLLSLYPPALLFREECRRRRLHAHVPFDGIDEEERDGADSAAEYDWQDTEVEITAGEDLPEDDADRAGHDRDRA